MPFLSYTVGLNMPAESRPVLRECCVLADGLYWY